MNARIRILVVDDDPQQRQAAGRLLVRQGFELLEAGSGAEAINLLATERVAAVLADMEMPGMNGVELLQHIRRRYPRLPVILVTPFFDDEVRESAALWGATAVLARPCQGAELATALGVALGSAFEAEEVCA